MSWPMGGSVLSSSVDGVLKAGRSSTCRIDGRRKESRAWGRGREREVARAEAVVYTVGETLGALLTVCWRGGGGSGTPLDQIWVPFDSFKRRRKIL